MTSPFSDDPYSLSRRCRTQSRVKDGACLRALRGTVAHRGTGAQGSFWALYLSYRRSWAGGWGWFPLLPPPSFYFVSADTFFPHGFLHFNIFFTCLFLHFYFFLHFFASSERTPAGAPPCRGGPPRYPVPPPVWGHRAAGPHASLARHPLGRGVPGQRLAGRHSGLRVCSSEFLSDLRTGPRFPRKGSFLQTHASFEPPFRTVR